MSSLSSSVTSTKPTGQTLQSGGLSSSEVNTLIWVICGFVVFFAAVFAFWAWMKRRAEKRHYEHWIKGELEKSLSAASGISLPYTSLPLVQELISGHSHSLVNIPPDVAQADAQSQESAQGPRKLTTSGMDTTSEENLDPPHELGTQV